jgi:hypothetical protein
MLDIMPDFYGMYVEDNEAWFISRVDNILYHLDVSKRECRFIAFLPESGREYWRGNRLCCKVKDMIICIPDRCKFVWVYKIRDKMFKSIELPKGVERWLITSYIVKQNLLYMMSALEKKIFVADIEKLKVLKTINLIQTDDIKNITADSVFENSIFYIVSGEESNIYKFDTDTEMFSKICVIEGDDQYNTLTFDGKVFWLSGRKREFLAINKETNEQKIINFENIPNDFKMYNFSVSATEADESGIEYKEYIVNLFITSFVWRGKIWFMPYSTSHIIYIDIYSNTIGYVELENETETIETIKNRGFLRTYKYFYERIEDDNKLVVYSMKNDCHYVIDGENGKCIEAFNDYKLVNYDEMMEYMCINSGLILHDYIEMDRNIFEYRLYHPNVEVFENNLTNCGHKLYYNGLNE